MLKLPISVCLIAGNEARRIRRALESVAGWTSEIIVVLNDDVNDGTDKIAESFGAKVFREPWKGHIAQKNSAAARAGAEWILGLDADEAVSPELREEIEKRFAAPENLQPFAAFSFPRCTFYCGRWIRHGDWYPDRQIRLWRRGIAPPAVMLYEPTGHGSGPLPAAIPTGANGFCPVKKPCCFG
ncbi:MAG TPA: glycosyltransferase family 2 protein [Verrucomicrobiae bacterium]|nr:glycosyltransferase family 2 protein [Verrucomicrobiae bacterium]